MNFIFNDNVCILCLSCNVKKVGKLVRFKQKGQKQASFLAFHKCCQGCLLRSNLYSLRNRHEKLAEGSLFCLFLKLVQINFIFTDNVRILYIYPAISTFSVQICYTNKFLPYSYQTNKLFSLRINF
jgi:hypothetical protein